MIFFLKKRVLLIFLLVALLSPFFLASAQTSSDAQSIGFPSSSIWYSQDPFYANEEVTIYALVVNTSTATIEGVLEFIDGDGVLGSRSFSVAPKGGSKVVSLTWTPSEGNHRISARIKEAYRVANGERTALVVTKGTTSYDDRVIGKRGAKEQGPLLSKANDLVDAGLEKVPEPVKEKTEEVTQGIEGFRMEKAEVMEDKINTLTTSLKDYESGKKERPKGEVVTPKNEDEVLIKPLAQVKRFFLQIGYVIFKTKPLFYVAGVLVVLFIFRFAYRKIFKRSEEF